MPIDRRSVTIMSSSGTAMNKYSTEAKADSYYGYADGIHTIQVVYANFVGRLHLQATLSLKPTATDWFDIVVSAASGLYAGSTAWNDAGYIQFNADKPATNSNAYTIKGNFTFVRAYMDRTYISDGTTYDASYGQINQIILSA